jgi:hypothetical protein
VWTGGKWFKVRDAKHWRDSPSGLRLFAAGGLAGAVAKTCVAPLERIKMLLQVQSMSESAAARGGARLGIAGMARDVLQRDGVRGFWRGNTANTVRIVPTKGILFAVNDQYRKLFGVDPAAPQPMRLVGCGAASGMTAALLTYPLDLVRSRLMMANASAGGAAYRGIADAARKILAQEGVRGLYGGLAPTLCGIVPYAGISFGAFGALKRVAPRDAETGKVTTATKLAIGAVAGVVSQTASFPIDTVRRRMQVQGAHGAPKLYRSARDCAAQLYRAEGPAGFYRGLAANVLRAAPNTAVQFAAYDYLCRQLDVRRS